MRIEEINGITVIVADEGKLLVNPYEMYSKQYWLGNGDSPDNYGEIDESMAFVENEVVDNAE